MALLVDGSSGTRRLTNVSRLDPPTRVEDVSAFYLHTPVPATDTNVIDPGPAAVPGGVDSDRRLDVGPSRCATSAGSRQATARRSDLPNCAAAAGLAKSPRAEPCSSVRSVAPHGSFGRSDSDRGWVVQATVRR